MQHLFRKLPILKRSSGYLSVSQQNLHLLLALPLAAVDDLDRALHSGVAVDTAVADAVAAPPDLLAQLVLRAEHPTSLVQRPRHSQTGRLRPGSLQYDSYNYNTKARTRSGD